MNGHSSDQMKGAKVFDAVILDSKVLFFIFIKYARMGITNFGKGLGWSLSIGQCTCIRI